VFIADGDRARMRKITLGERNNEAAQVVDGLKPGEQVVLYPPDTLADGARIRARVTAAVER
jgi:HlyD family secretion protein